MSQKTLIKTNIKRFCKEFKSKNCLGEYITLINGKFETINCSNCKNGD